MSTAYHGAVPARSSATTPVNRQSAAQNCSGDSSDQAYSEGLSCTAAAGPPSGRTASRMKRVTLARAIWSGVGIQSGVGADVTALSPGARWSEVDGEPSEDEASVEAER